MQLCVHINIAATEDRGHVVGSCSNRTKSSAGGGCRQREKSRASLRVRES